VLDVSAQSCRSAVAEASRGDREALLAAAPALHRLLDEGS